MRTYDAAGHAILDEHRKPDGTLVASFATTYDASGRPTSTTYKDAGRTLTSTTTYKLDASGRVIERVQRSGGPASEFRRIEYRWEPDGSRTEQAYRHYATEGPYRSDSEMFDAKGRRTRSCAEHGGCSMIEYDAHGEISRIRQQDRDEHHYLVYASAYDAKGRLMSQTMGNTTTEYTWGKRDPDLVITRDGTAITSKTVYSYTYR